MKEIKKGKNRDIKIYGKIIKFKYIDNLSFRKIIWNNDRKFSDRNKFINLISLVKFE